MPEPAPAAYLLSTYGTRGDVEPLVALAVRLRALGAGVRMCVPPDEEFAHRLAGPGIPLVPLGPPMRELMGGTAPLSAAELSRYRTELVDAQFAVLPEAAEGCDVLVVAGLAQVGARSVAEAAGLHYVYVTYAAVNLPSPHHAPPPRPGWPESAATDNRTLWESDARNVNAQFAETLNGHRAALGLPPVHDVRDHVYSDRPWLAADPVLGPWPRTPGLDVVQTGAWTLPDERPLPAELVAFLAAGAPPVYVGFGSARPSPDIGHRAVEAIRAHGQRVLVSRGWADLDLADGRDDLFAIGEVNQQRLFPRVAAVVHHGGAGTTQTAARAGVPQVVIPLPVSDNPYWAGRVAAAGAGAALHGPTTEALRGAVETVLAPETRARAKALGARMRTDGADLAAEQLAQSPYFSV
ncbi:vancomycin aglycone glucosyltransferase [Amycolatopsis bartoniae]|uniref:Glycosyl transferase n=1 Tax=Amycolatopsis bartoniae TaxID=941986 RepID=A0A8H9MDS2_9PSEU|nr:glycosyltransferase [Amycolatopsis bartoniae]MBB2939795.1 vancomycin aglycone glucosyltransferase [Amycolatopsis bartoniae]TVT07496.1 glycosyltransferase family 1 protein [Amycolatopsis bartoniae]GHF54557.1 glycosyl transferase [Amycolatopsis bartoniae]